MKNRLGQENMRKETELVLPTNLRKHFKPQQEWKVIIAIYLYLAGMGAGSFIIGTLIHWAGAAFNPISTPFIELLGIRFDITKIPILWGPVMEIGRASCRERV